jgi:pyridoxal phosphate enzyme (YggS family)
MIKENTARLLRELPGNVELVAAAKTRTAAQILQAIEGGVKIVGENYIQEAQAAFSVIGRRVKWHFIGHLQKNKVKKAVRLFDMIETVDSASLAGTINKECAKADKVMPVLVEINSAREEQKFGVLPEKAAEFIEELSRLKNIKVMGLMTMGPDVAGAELIRPYFAETKKLFDEISALDIKDVEMKYLSMGMTNSFSVAIEEGANIVRIGSAIFGE